MNKPKKIEITVCDHVVKIEIKKCNEKAGFQLAMQGVIQVVVCKNNFEWLISIVDGILDVTPLLRSFANVSFNCYAVSDQLFNDQPNQDGQYNLVQVAEILVTDFLTQQQQNVLTLINENNRNLETAIELLSKIKNITMILWKDDKKEQKILCEIPLLSDPDNQDPSMEYILEVTENDSIRITIDLTITFNSFTVQYKVVFPSSMNCSKHIEFPKAFPCKFVHEDDLDELIPSIQNRISSGWTQRKIFLEELQSLTAVLEYDAVDMAFVLIVIRMKHEKMYTICTIEFRLAHNFPSSVPLISLHDLQNDFSSPIDTSSIKVTKKWTAKRVARELLLLCSSVISQQAFGTDILVDERSK